MERGKLPLLFLLKCLFISYILTAGLLLLLALFVYKFSLSEKIVSIFIIGIYIAATFFAGFIAGKKLQSKKFIWGLVLGVCYFLILVILSVIVNHSLKDVATNFFSVLALCGGSGMLGGMLS